MARFSVWNGTSINPAYQSLEDAAAAIEALKPAGRWSREWLVKAGEGGTWQARWDPIHPLALSGQRDLAMLRNAGLAMRPRLYVTPYIVVRGQWEWKEAEWSHIATCLATCGKVVLNLEDGAQYWNGPTDAAALRAEYLEPLQARLSGWGGLKPDAAGRFNLELCCIPRSYVLRALGGVLAINTWLDYCRSASWECYDELSPHPGGDSGAAECLEPVHAFERLEALGVWGDERRNPRRIPVVQRSRIGAWASHPVARRGLQVWHLDGDI